MQWLTLAACAPPLMVWAAAGWFSRYAADDYCTAGLVRTFGFLGAQPTLYRAWSGRFTATLEITFAELIGPGVVQVLPACALLAWCAAATWSVRQLSAALGHHASWLACAVLATLVVYATLATSADLPQVLFWQTGLLTYLFPLVLLTMLVGWLARRTAGGPLVSFILALLVAGSSETLAAALTTGLLLATLFAARTRANAGPHYVRSLLAALAGAVAALCIVAIAPGNQVRQETVSGSDLPTALADSVQFGLGWLRLTFSRPQAPVVLLLISLPALVFRPSDRRPHLWQVGLAAAAGALVILAALLPAFYALTSNPPGRAQLAPQFVLVCAIGAAGFALAPVIPARARAWLKVATPVWIALLLVLGPVAMAIATARDIPAAQAYGGAWDALDASIRAKRASGVRDLSVPPLASSGLVQNLAFIGPRSDDWLNECVARLYDLDSIVART